MRPNIVSQAGLSTRFGQWWGDIPFLTSSVVIICGAIYLLCLLVGYDSFAEVCFWPSAVISRFQVYRIYTSVIFHGSLVHVLFNMMALVPLGSELERVMGSVRLLCMIILLATSNAIFHLLIALLVAHNPFPSDQYLMNECAIGFSGILFSMIVIETSLSGVQHRSVFGLFNVPVKWYAWILLVVFQLLLTNVSLLGHLSGILSGFAYTCGLFNFLLPGTSFYSAIESSSWLSAFVRRPKFIVCTGGNASGYIPTYSSQDTTSSNLLSGNIWRNLSSWMPQRETSAQSAEVNNRFPGTGRTLGSGNQTVSTVGSDSSLQARLLDNGSSHNHPSDSAATVMVHVDQQIVNERHDAVKALNVYKRAGKQAESLADFYEYCKGLDLARNFQFPTLRQPPPSFLATMEEYIKEAPQTAAVSNKRLEYRETSPEPQQPEEPEPQEREEQVEEVEDKEPLLETQEEPEPEPEEEKVLPLISPEETGDLLGLNEINPKAAELEESNALALAIVTPGNDPLSASYDLSEIGKTSGWELALVTTPSNNISHATESKLAGGFDKLLLDSLYEDEASRRQIQLTMAGYNTGHGREMNTPNPFDQRDPFIMSNNIAPPTNVQMAMMQEQQQQHQMMQQQQQSQQQYHQQNMLTMTPHMYLPQYPQQQQQMPFMGSANSFGDPFDYPQNPMPPHGNHSFL